MKYFLPILLLFTFAIVACEDDEDPFSGEVELSMNFKGEFGGQDLAIQRETYQYPGGEALKVQLFQYYVSDLALIPADGSADVELSEIELIRYMSATEDDLETRTFTVPVGNYSGVRFGLGVKPALNSLDPNNFSATDPLNENEFWNARARYVFAKIEANADLTGGTTFDTPITLHMGSDALYQTVTLNQNFTFAPGRQAELTLTADILKAMGGTSETYDIEVPENQRVHGGNQATAAAIFNRLGREFTLEQ